MFLENIWNRKRTFFRIEMLRRGRPQGSYIERANKPFILSTDDEEYRITPVKMTEKKFKGLPEFQGF